MGDNDLMFTSCGLDRSSGMVFFGFKYRVLFPTFFCLCIRNVSFVVGYTLGVKMVYGGSGWGRSSFLWSSSSFVTSELWSGGLRARLDTFFSRVFKPCANLSFACINFLWVGRARS